MCDILIFLDVDTATRADIKNNRRVDSDEGGIYRTSRINVTYGKRFFRVPRYNFNKSEISGAGEKGHGFGVTTTEERGRRCVGLIYRRTIAYTCGWRHLFLPTFAVRCGDWMRPTGIFLDFGT